MLKTRVSDGARTRDNRSHNPLAKSRSRALGSDGPPVSLRDSVVRSEGFRTGSEFLPQTPVVVTAGLSAGRRGVVVSVTPHQWETEDGGSVPMICIELPMPHGLRVIRADYLAVAS